MISVAMLPLISDPDNVKISSENPETPSTDGWQRLKKMFQIDEFGDVSRELGTISQTAMLSSFVGIMYGGFINSRTSYTDFMKRNTAASFTSHFEAKRKLQDTVTKSFGRGAWKWGWRLCLFSTTFVGLSTMISVYRGKNGIIEHVLAGAGTGALYKWQMGPRGWIVGCGLGALLGVTSGTLTIGLLKITGLTMDEVREYQQSFGDLRKKVFREGIKKQLEKEDTLLKSHEEKSQENGLNSIGEDKE
ncbi:hypothetical protein HHI36_009417 [Cryptolaemus montrouzieri]|uniref:Complex I assembly factor TIMMDC1, mitochondrial n=1 Tax=Cryptolaemus montrouzieri TaxID=559131 RepID=A0ABD2MW66_9CUCU